MYDPPTTLIAAVTTGRVLDYPEAVARRFAADRRRFRRLTWGGAVIMGRKTHERLGRPLEGRENIVVSRRSRRDAEVRWARSLEEAIGQAHDRAVPHVWIMGGGEIYRAALADEWLLAGADLTELPTEAPGEVTLAELPSRLIKVRCTTHEDGRRIVGYERRAEGETCESARERHLARWDWMTD